MGQQLINSQPTDIIYYLNNTVALFPNALAVVDSNELSLTYQELSNAADRIATSLHQHHVVSGDRVGILMHKTSLTLASIFGVLRLGAAYVPVDAGSTTIRAATIFNNCSVQAILTTSELAKTLIASEPQFKSRIIIIQEKRINQSNDLLDYPTVDPTQDDIDAYPHYPSELNRLAYILYTSGSTGVPKGVEITHANAISFIEWASSTFAITKHDHVSSHAPFHFDLSIFDIYVAIKHGACIHLIDSDIAASPRHLAAFISNREITVWYSAPAILGMLAEHFQRLSTPPPQNKLRLVLFAGEVFPIAKLRLLMHHWPAPNYYNLYGPTETNVCTFYPVPSNIPESRINPLPIGFPCKHCEAIIIDEQEHRIVPHGETGLLCITGPSVTDNYWNSPEQMAAKVVWLEGKRWYNTGDRVRFSDKEGFIFLGRNDRMIKRLGYRIELDEIEKILTTHPDLMECAVVSQTIHSNPRIYAFIVAKTAQASSLNLHQYCHNHLAHYMLPDLFHYLDSIPRTSTGKTDYKKLEVLCSTIDL
ncbi:amino acid adenylation domain-containing protein [Providencia stuartii]|uniref:amino acid adenylation domain-containing protein n=1 Tax=Providencia stuartii TaxID=588 RepID=UPI00111EBF52|nr:amino acid adenylation domain-containing protein [Providencia stuartii]